MRNNETTISTFSDQLCLHLTDQLKIARKIARDKS